MKIRIIVGIYIVIFLGALLHFLLHDFNELDKYRYTSNERPTVSTRKFKLGFITGIGGLGDNSYNDLQYNGIVKINKQFGFKYKAHSLLHHNDIPKIIKKFVEKDSCNIIVCGSAHEFHGHLDSLAPVYPNVKFLLMDGFAKRYHPNIASISFKQNEGSFLAGYLAAKMSKTKKIASIGGLRIPAILDFMVGYERGAKLADSTCEVITRYISDENPNINPWQAPKKAKKIADNLYDKENVDIIYGVASASNFGIFNSAKEHNTYAIGVDHDQDYLMEGRILTSVIKKFDKALMYIVYKIINNSFENKLYNLGIREGGVALSPMLYTKDLIPEKVLFEIEEIKKKIVDKQIIVPSVFSY